MDAMVREVLLGFWKVHILHHAAAGSVYGQGLLEELARHGYRLSPGTLYPILARMERHGWLQSESGETPKARRNYRITPKGQEVLDKVRALVSEMYREVVQDSE